MMHPCCDWRVAAPARKVGCAESAQASLLQQPPQRSGLSEAAGQREVPATHWLVEAALSGLLWAGILPTALQSLGLWHLIDGQLREAKMAQWS